MTDELGGDLKLDVSPFREVAADLPDETRLWRYMDLAKFADLLLTRTLWFNRIDRFEDPLEGTLPPGFQRYFSRGLEREDAEKFWRTQAEGHDAFRRKWVYTNCWHERDHESYAFWRIYAGGGAGIAISASVAGLKRAFTAHQPSLRRVQYIDFDNDAEDYRRFHWTERAFWHKHKVYDYEREVRAIITLPIDSEPVQREERMDVVEFGEMFDGLIAHHRLRESPPGISAPVELDELVEKVFVSPYAQPWFTNVVRGLCGALQVKAEIIQSSIRVAL